MPTEMELTLEQTQQGVSYEVSVLSDIEDSHGPSDAMHNPLPATQSQKDFVSKLTEIHSFLLTFSLRNIRVNSFTMKMEILLESTSNKLMVEHAEYDESNTYVLERFNTSAGNPVKKILLKLNLSDHRLCKMVVEVPDSSWLTRSITTCSYPTDKHKVIMKAQNFKKDATLKLFKNGMSMSVQKSQVHKVAKLQVGDCAWFDDLKDAQDHNVKIQVQEQLNPEDGYSQWRSRFLRYIDTKPNGEGLRKSILFVPSAITGESLNVQDVKTNLFWEFGKFTSRDGESMESYYSRFYKLMNELTRNNLQVTTMQVNVQFLQQLQPEWSRFVTVVNDIRAERIAKSANPLALLTAAQPYSDNYYQAPKPQRSNATSSSTRPSASTRHKGKEIAKPVTPQSESVSKEDSDPEQAQRDKDMQKNLALLEKYFKGYYKTYNKTFELL
ncbi:hypothetical protein Tco_1438128 [Tanacetum coccineum]